MIVRDKSNSWSIFFAWQGTILPKILPSVLAMMLLSVLAWLMVYHQVYAVTSVPMTAFTIFGVLISITLGFYHHASYDRWWEGRKLWGALVANTRHLSRDSHFLSPDEREKLLGSMLLFVVALRDRLRQQAVNASDDLYFGKHADKISWLDTQLNAPQRVLEEMQEQLIALVRQGQMSDIIYLSIQKHIVEMGGIQAGCDRIAGTPLPFAYSALLSHAIVGFCWLLPFGAGAVMGGWTPLFVGLVAYFLLGLHELARQMEMPFGIEDNDLSLDTLVHMIQSETLMLLEKPLPQKREVIGFCLK
ncbi:bestrophin family protein [Moraxella sp.]|uniref:bestrophin family protein n=1 Tax=Moraxella sp. TaxID=479 RepID=UPI0026DA85F2|nr:bestrophin family ion channel [Moraxella sp.]MDO4895465.1 bestrophin family ion channel [Moraxella sp.]